MAHIDRDREWEAIVAGERTCFNCEYTRAQQLMYLADHPDEVGREDRVVHEPRAATVLIVELSFEAEVPYCEECWLTENTWAFIDSHGQGIWNDGMVTKG